jgi:hypothetical protein
MSPKNRASEAETLYRRAALRPALPSDHPMTVASRRTRTFAGRAACQSTHPPLLLPRRPILADERRSRPINVRKASHLFYGWRQEPSSWWLPLLCCGRIARDAPSAALLGAATQLAEAYAANCGTAQACPDRTVGATGVRASSRCSKRPHNETPAAAVAGTAQVCRNFPICWQLLRSVGDAAAPADRFYTRQVSAQYRSGASLVSRRDPRNP